MAETRNEEVILMAVLAVTRGDILTGADELGISGERVTEEVVGLVKEKIREELGNWQEAVGGMVKEVIKKEAAGCPLGMTCSPACTWREVGGCISIEKVN